MSNVKKTISSFSPSSFLVCCLVKGTNVKLTNNFGYNSATSMFKSIHLRNILFPILICFSKIIFRSLSLTKAPQKIQWECLIEIQCTKSQHKLQDSSTMLDTNLIIFQQDATHSVYYISVGSSTCFGC